MNAPALHALKVRCRFCSKFRHPAEFVVNPTVGACFTCHQGHMRALDALATGDPPSECAYCQTSTELLPRNENGDLSMRLHDMDGTIAFLCFPCSDEYEQKRRDQFAGTPYGHAKGLSTRT